MPNQLSFRYFKTSPEIIQLAVMPYVSFPPSLRNLEDLLHERGVDACYKPVRYWWHRFGLKKPWKNFRMFTNTAVMLHEMAWYPTGNPPLTLSQCRSVGNVGILENFSGEILWGLFGFAYIAYIPYTIISLL